MSNAEWNIDGIQRVSNLWGKPERFFDTVKEIFSKDSEEKVKLCMPIYKNKEWKNVIFDGKLPIKM